MADSYSTLARIVGTLRANRGHRDIEQMLHNLGSLLETLDAEMIKHFELRKVAMKFASHVRYGNRARHLVVRFNEIMNRSKIEEKRDRLPYYLRGSRGTLEEFKISKKEVTLSLSQPTLNRSPRSPTKSILKKKSKYSPVPKNPYPSCEDEEEYTVVPAHRTESTSSTDAYVPATYTPGPRRAPVQESLYVPGPIQRQFPRLFTLCEQFLLEDPFKPIDVHVPFSRLSHLLEALTADLLHTVEITMPWLESGIESIWRKRLAREFSTARLYPMETYGEAYRRCLVEKEISDEAIMHTHMIRLLGKV